MSHSFKPISSVASAARAYCAETCFIAFLALGLASPALARDVKVPEPIFDEAAARDACSCSSYCAVRTVVLRYSGGGFYGYVGSGAAACG